VVTPASSPARSTKTARAGALAPALLWSLVGAACGPVAGPVTVEALVPDPDASGGVAFADVELATITDLTRGTGEQFDVRGGLRVNLSDLSALSDGSFDEMVDATRGDGGVDLAPRMAKDGDRYVAEDFETLFYFTVFANFEAAFAFAREAGDDSDATKRKSLVGMFAQVQISPLLPLPVLSSDNAAYAAPVDGWLALRTGVQEGVPLSMHRGVIQHEFGHRLFFQNAFRTVDGGFDVWREDITQTELDEEQLRAQMLLKGADEGLADVFAVAALRDPTAVSRAFAEAGGFFAPEADRRDFEGAFATAATFENLRDLTLDTELLEGCGLSTADFRAQFNFYCIGTLLGAALWETAGRDVDVLADEIEPAVIRALPAVGEARLAGPLFDLDVLLEPLARELPAGERRSAWCAALRARFASYVDAGRVPSCG
jgi:hypothetical protein